MKNLTLARLIDTRGKTLEPPAPAGILLEDGVPAANYDLNEIFTLALSRIEQQRAPTEAEFVKRFEALRPNKERP